MSNSDFIVLDVETANADYASICQIGLVEVVAGEVVSQEAILVNPDDYFDGFNTSIHGITADHVCGAPLFHEVHAALSQRLSGSIIVHHGPFDRVSISRACERCGIESFDVQWLDNQRVVRRVWEQFSKSGYALKSLAAFFGIEFQHHDALQDAIATNEIFRRALNESGTTAADWLSRIKQSLPTTAKTISGDGNPDGPFSGETIVFTGELNIPRSEAADIAKRLGFRVEDGVTKRTTVLCAGVQDRTKTGGYDKSSKHRKAESLAGLGQDIRILSEGDFWAIVPKPMRPNVKTERPPSERSNHRGQLIVSLSLEDLFTDEELQRMLTGMPLSDA
ncbi:Exonuclease [Nitrobacter hamburgensis X14]|uniref:Exonuclease n=1 Tax=Nitrobacter hamburgensis (strain DSM 10229 / NCIMB 13809 / X14) TaxID=323097 RepID=Q1QRC1_NITHX|nr:exonuclease domain-containing protein [Nitrobacter hamburgensis]ABE61226.1 Exonuclease [Nitrobacter hamburgensis X14]